MKKVGQGILLAVALLCFSGCFSGEGGNPSSAPPKPDPNETPSIQGTGDTAPDVGAPPPTS